MSAQVGDVVATAEELDWLPDWSAVVDAQGDVAQRLPGGRWFYPDSSPVTTSKASKYGPFTVLYLPDAHPRPERVVKAEALREAAATWQTGGWAEALPHGALSRTALILGMAQRAVEWLRAQADRIEATR